VYKLRSRPTVVKTLTHGPLWHMDRLDTWTDWTHGQIGHILILKCIQFTVAYKNNILLFFNVYLLESYAWVTHNNHISNGPMIVSSTQRRKRIVFYSAMKYGCSFLPPFVLYILGQLISSTSDKLEVLNKLETWNIWLWYNYSLTGSGYMAI